MSCCDSCEDEDNPHLSDPKPMLSSTHRECSASATSRAPFASVQACNATLLNARSYDTVRACNASSETPEIRTELSSNHLRCQPSFNDVPCDLCNFLITQAWFELWGCANAEARPSRA
eukprot:2367879-Amphidinium_carterae.1